MSDDGFLSNGDRNDKRLTELVPGERFHRCTFAFCDAQVRPTRSGKSFLLLRLRDRTAVKTARWFTPPADILEQLQEAQLVCVSGVVDNQPGQYYGEIKIHDCAVAALPDDLSPYMQPLPRDHAMHRARFFELIRSVQNPHCRELLKVIFDQNGKHWPLFESAPAASRLHHGYRGGLLEHTGEVAALCDSICSSLPYLDRDLLLTGALLHDLGKLEELEQEIKAGQYTARGNLIGHVVLGTCMVHGAIESIADFPDSLRDEILHLIISHHGKPEFGAAKMPMFAEAIVLNLCDLMSARIAQCRELLESEQENDFSDIFGWESRSVYLLVMKRMMAQYS